MNQVAAKRQVSQDTIRIAAFNGNGSAGEWEIKKELLIIGRISTNDVCLNDKKVSRTHCTVELRPEGLFLKDGGSSNGTWVNGQKVSEILLKDLDVVVISGYRLQLSLERAPASAPWDDKTALSPEVADSTPAEEDNVIPMRKSGVLPTAPAAERSIRTEIVERPKMEAEAKAAVAEPKLANVIEKAIEAPAKAEAAKPVVAEKPATTRPAVMYVGGKRVVNKPAPMQKTNPQTKSAAATSTVKVAKPVVAGEKKPMSKGMKIALALGRLFAFGMFFLLTVGGGIIWYVMSHQHHVVRHF